MIQEETRILIVRGSRGSYLNSISELGTSEGWSFSKSHAAELPAWFALRAPCGRGHPRCQ